MADYISREAALAKCKRHYDYTAWSIADGIKAIPTADVEPVRHGEWEAVDWREYDENSCEVICYPKDGIACTHCRWTLCGSIRTSILIWPLWTRHMVLGGCICQRYTVRRAVRPIQTG